MAANYGRNSHRGGPNGHLISSGNTLYETRLMAAVRASDTVCSHSSGSVSPPQLTIIPFGADLILTWPTNAAGFNLQSTTSLVSPPVWTTVSPDPVAINGQNTVSDALSGTCKFYRLSQSSFPQPWTLRNG